MMPHSRPRRPDFVIGGAPKTGTTSLCSLLALHPDLFITTPKEPHYYLSHAWGRPACGMNLARQDYEALYDDCLPEQMAGEGSTWYLQHSDLVVPELHGDNPTARLIFLLRNPIDRAYSDYWFHLNRGTLPSGTGFSDYVKNSEHWLFKGGNYENNLRHFSRVFGRESVLAILTEDLHRAPASVLRQICEHIGVDPNFNFPKLPQENVTRYPRSPQLMQHWGKRLPGLSRWMARGRVLRLVRSRLLFSETSPKPPMSDLDRLELVSRYRGEIERLESFLNRDLKTWKHEAGKGG